MLPSDPITAGLSFLAEQTSQALVFYDVEANRFAYQNPAFRSLFPSVAEQETAPKALLEMVHSEDRQFVQEYYQKLLEGEGGKEVEFRVQHPQLGERWLCLKPSVMQDAAGKKQVLSYVDDVTASRVYNDYMKKYASKKDSVLHILAHDLAGPLGVIRSLSSLLAEEVKPYGSAELNKLIGVIEATSAHGVHLIQNLTDHEFLETTGTDLIKRRVNMVEKFIEVIEQYRQSEEKLKLAFRFSVSSDTIYAALDDTKFMQAINNLIANSIKFTPQGGQIAVSLEEREQTVLVKVEDTGIGIPKKYHDNLFDKFTIARRPGLNGEQATGLGMSIVKTIVEWHQGTISFESEEGNGTTFCIEVPKE